MPDDVLTSIDEAIALWHGHGIDSLVRVTDDPSPELVLALQHGNPLSFGYYDYTAAKIELNDILPASEARTIVIAHELGHAFGLVHVAPETRASVMNPGNTKVAPNPSDAAALIKRWGACGTSDAP
jgi:hypothetical protein